MFTMALSFEIGVITAVVMLSDIAQWIGFV
jgi:hypothetical protein